MLILVLASLFSVGFAQPPVWWTDGQCGISKYDDAGDMNLPPGAKIVGGIEASPYEFPWQVSVRYLGIHRCGGSIISDRWIICAAHCTDGLLERVLITVVVGEHDRNAISTVRQTHGVTAIFVHENYTSSTFKNDISLIQTDVAITFSFDVLPICAPDPANDYVYYKSQCSGWGLTSSGGILRPSILRYVTLNVTTNAFCDAIYTTDTISADMICATDNTGMNERGFCQGDSGGPLSTKSSDLIFSLIGVASWGIGCASGYPGVYARVGYFTAWVTDMITSN